MTPSNKASSVGTGEPDVVEGESLPLVFILGNSHCGSTLFGMLLSSNPSLINFGELKTRTWLKDRQCSCGHPVDDCQIYKGYFSTFNELKKTGISRLREMSSARFFFQKKIPLRQHEIAALTQLHTSLSARVRNIYPNARYMVDCSKSLWMLNAWLQIIPKDQMRILWLKRNTAATVSSFTKRGVPFFTSLMSILVNTHLTGKFLKRNNLDFRTIDYNRFFAHYAEEAKTASDFIGVDLPSTYIDHGNHHVISGNNYTRRDFVDNFKGIRPDTQWEQLLMPWQKKLISWIS
jgi:hypothetical protein